MTTRICPRCMLDKPLEDFGGNVWRCKECRAEAWRFAMAEKRDRERFAEQVSINRLINWPAPREMT